MDNFLRLAAYIDGGGCISICGTQLRLSVTNTDIRLINWCVENFGGSTIQLKRRSIKHSIANVWYIGDEQAAILLEKLLPYFLIKKEQAELAIAYRDTYKKRIEIKEKLSEIKGTSSKRGK